MAQSRKRRKTNSNSKTFSKPAFDQDSQGKRYVGSPDVISELRRIEAQFREDLGEFVTRWELEDFLPNTVPMIMDKIRASLANGTHHSEKSLNSMIQGCIPVVTSRRSGQKYEVLYTTSGIALVPVKL